MSKTLHVLSTLVVAPYAALAVGFLMIGRMASQRGLWDALDALLVDLNRVLSWGVFVFALVFLAIAGLGIFDRHARTASAALALVAAISLAILLVLGSGPMEAGQWFFLVPCIVALGVACRQVLRRG